MTCDVGKLLKLLQELYVVLVGPHVDFDVHGHGIELRLHDQAGNESFSLKAFISAMTVALFVMFLELLANSDSGTRLEFKAGNRCVLQP